MKTVCSILAIAGLMTCMVAGKAPDGHGSPDFSKLKVLSLFANLPARSPSLSYAPVDIGPSGVDDAAP